MEIYQMAMGFGWGAAGGVILMSFLNLEFMIIPALILGGGLGAAFMGGFINV